jgi:hypothetical protein
VNKKSKGVSVKPSIPNKTVLEILRLIDGNPSAPKPVIFRFSAEEESSLYRLAGVLKKRGYTICLHKGSSGRWSCSAEREIMPEEEPLDTLCIRMVHLADKHEVVFENWETVIEGKKTDG